jgi:superfamily II DNA or RNA helicase
LQITKLIELKNQITVDMHFTRKTISHEKRIVCNFDKEKQRRVMYDRWDIYDNAPIRDISKLCYLLRRVSNSDPDRLVKLKEIFEEHNKIVLFYNFNYELSALRKFAKKNGISYSEWNGHKHEPIPNTDSWLYLVQYIAGSEGWNCIETDTVVFFSQNYSYRIMIQAAGRIDRLNTPFVDLYYYTLTSNSEIDQAIGKALRQKRKFNENRFTSL